VSTDSTSRRFWDSSIGTSGGRNRNGESYGVGFKSPQCPGKRA
jgi:hypothetical protein